jgi:hypothetical protein
MWITRESLLEELPEAGCGGGGPGAGRGRIGRRTVVLSALLATLLLAAALAHLTASASANASTPITWGSPQSIDKLAPYTQPNGFQAMSCTSGLFCVGTTAFGDIISSSNPTGTSASDWSVLPGSLLAGGASPYGLAAISCTGSFCATGGGDINHSGAGVILTSTNPTSASASDWKHASISDSNPIQFIQCQSSSSCIAVDNDGYVLSYNGTAWTKSGSQLIATSPYNLTGLSCPSAGLCLASDYSGDVFISDAPTNLSNLWTEETSTTTGLSDAAGGVSCSSTSDCSLLSESTGVAAYTTDASAVAPAWTVGTSNPGLTNGTNGSLTCVAGTSACLVGAYGGQLFTSTDGSATFSQVSGFPPSVGDPTAIGCAGSSLCVAGSDTGEVSASTHPTVGSGSVWSAGVLAAPGRDSVRFGPSSCASPTLCVGADSQGRLFTGTPGSFTERSLSGAGGLGAPICPSSSLCVDNAGGAIFSSTDPASGGSSWKDSAPNAAGGDFIQNLSCPSASLCVGVTGTNKLISSTDPSGTSWAVSTNPVESNNSYVGGLTCPSSTLCVGFANRYPGGYTFASATPSNVNSGWSASAAPVDANGLNGISCSSSSLCVAWYGGAALTSTHPATNSWSAPVTVDPTNQIISLVCPSNNLCVGYDDKGDLVTTTDPTGGASAWSVSSTPIDSNLITRLACPSASLCLLGDAKGDVLESSDPAGGSGTWSAVKIDPGHSLQSLTCAGTALCLAADDDGNVVEGTVSSPTGSGAAGKASVKGTSLTDTLSCHGSTGQTCTLKMSLTVVETLKGKKVVAVTARAKRKKTVTIGSKTVTLQAGQTKKETVKLNRKGLALLKKRHKLPVSFTVKQGAGTVRHQTVHFKYKKG